MANILITGGSGLIGTRLTELLLHRGHRVSHLGRTMHGGDVRSFIWNVERRLVDSAALEGVDIIVHLAGAGIADKPWTDERKREILESRTNSTRLLVDILKKRNHTVKSVIAASAMGYYGFENQEESFREGREPGKGFLADVVHRWEKEVDAFGELGVRVVKIRTGIVLSKKGGALEEIARPVRYYVGAPLGTGNQVMSWIHLDDLCNIFVKAAEDGSMQGAYNAVSPNPVTNKEFTKAIARTLGKPVFLPPIPSFILKFLLGEMADLVLGGSKLSAEKIIGTGYTFQFPEIDQALQNLLKGD